MPVEVRQLKRDDIALMYALLVTFGEAFNDVPTYTLKRLLGGDSFIAVVALKNGDVEGGIAACELKKVQRRTQRELGRLDERLRYVRKLALAEPNPPPISVGLQRRTTGPPRRKLNSRSSKRPLASLV